LIATSWAAAFLGRRAHRDAICVDGGKTMKLKDYKAVSPAMYRELDVLFAKHGFSVKKLNAGVDEHFGVVSLSIKLADLNFTDAAGNATSSEAEFYKANCTYVDCKSEWLGMSFKTGGRTYVLTGMRNTRGAKCITVTRDDDKRFVYTAEGIRGIFALQAQPITLASALKRSLAV
jgi:hypothetical protein